MKPTPETAERKRSEVARLTAEFVSPALEASFRADAAEQVARQLRNALTFGSLFFLLLAYNDYLALGGGDAFLSLLALRLSAVAVAAAVLLIVSKRPAAADIGATAVGLAVAGVFLTTMALGRPQEIPFHGMTAAVLMIALFMFLPNRFLLATLVNTVILLGFPVLLGLQQVTNTEATQVLILLALAYATGLACAHRYHTMRRQEYAVLLEAERMNVSLADEVCRRMSLESELTRLATTDPLTGLWNRRQYFELSMQESRGARRHGQSLTVGLLDIDHFKAVNDLHGHAAGDEVLRAVAETLRETLREEDIVGRFGGEEFAITFPATTLAQGKQVAERLRQRIAAQRIEVAGEHVQLTATIGLAEWPPHSETLDEALRRADDALYEGKNDGRNRVVVGAKAGATAASGAGN